MKKIFKLMSACIMMVVCLVASSGCSCAKPMNVYYTVNQSNENKENTVKAKIEVRNILNLKYREPADTPCYKKVEGSYELIEDARGIYECYDSEGNYFEKATYNRKEKEQLENEFPIRYNQDTVSYKSSKTAVPKNENYSLIYEFIITNKEETTIYLREITVNDILKDQIKDEDNSLNIIKITLPSGTEVIDNKEYYRIDANQKINIIIEIQELTTKDSAKKAKDLNLNIDLVVKK